MHRFQQYASVHSTATVRSEHSSHRALHEIFTTGSIISARSFMSPVMLSVTWQRLEISHTVSQNSACPRRLKWRQSACRLTVPMRLGATRYRPRCNVGHPLHICLHFYLRTELLLWPRVRILGCAGCMRHSPQRESKQAGSSVHRHFKASGGG